jgi:cytoskeleton protein RodZ
MPESIGRQLKQAREYRHLTLEKAAEATRIRPHYLKALETDDYSSMVSAAQARGFLRNYAEFLGLNIDQLLSELQKPKLPEAEGISGPLQQVEVKSSAAGGGSPSDERRHPRATLLSWLSRRPKKEARPKGGSPATAQDESLPDQAKSQMAELPEPALKTSSRRSAEKSKAETPIKHEKKIRLSSDESLQTEALRASKRVAGTLVQKEAIKTTADGQAPEGEKNLIDSVKDIPGEPGRSTRVETETEEARPSILARLKRIFNLRIISKGADQKSSVEENPETSVPGIESQGKATLPSAGKSAEAIFVGIGLELRTRRELLSLTLDEIERHIRVRPVLLKALEEGAFDKLPSPVQTRGILANYATFLDLDTEALMLQFADGLQARLRQKYPEKLRPKGPIQSSPSMPPLRSFIAGDLLFGIGTVAILAGLAIWGLGRLLNPAPARQSIQSTAPSISEVLAGTVVASFPQEVTLIPAESHTLPPPEATLEGTLEVPTLLAVGNVELNLVAVERTFMRVKVDGGEAFNGRVLPGTAYPFVAEDQIEVLTGNGAALRVMFNGRDLGLMGNLGEVVSRIYTREGIATGTPTLSPTLTVTPKVTMTPTLTPTTTPTLKPSATP